MASFVENVPYKMTTRPPTEKATGSAFDTTSVAKKDSLVRAGAHSMATTDLSKSAAFGAIPKGKSGRRKSDGKMQPNSVLVC